MLQETYDKVIYYLAGRAEATQYEIANATKISYAPIHQAVKKLLFLNIIKETRQEKGQGPLPKRFFKLTFSGFITALALFGRVNKSENELKNCTRKAIQVHGKFYQWIKIFSEWDSFERWLGIQAYQFVCSAALWVTENKTPAVAAVYQRNGRWYFTNYAMAKKYNEECKRLGYDVAGVGPIEIEDTAWEVAFTEQLVELIWRAKLYQELQEGKITPIPNKNLHDFFHEILELKIKEAHSDIERTNMMKKAFKQLHHAS